MNNFKKYLITDPKYYSNDLTLFKQNLSNILKSKEVDIACFRDKESNNFEELASIFVDVCKTFHIDKILINTDYKLAHKLNASGVHLNSTQFNMIKTAKDLGLYTIISCHTFEDIKKARDLNIDAVTYSPIFETPNKGAPKGIEALKEVVDKYPNINIIALGGIINDKQIEQISKTKAYGFASIRYFV